MPFIPFDADEDEISDLEVLRDGIPVSLRPALFTWMLRQLNDGRMGSTSPQWLNFIQSSLRIDLGYDPASSPLARDLLERIETMGTKWVLRVVDLLLSAQEFSHFSSMPHDFTDLQAHLELNGSVFKIGHDETTYRLTRRLPDGTADLARESIGVGGVSGTYLAKAWNLAYQLQPDPSAAMTEAIRAVEAACIPVVLPRDGAATLHKCIKTMRDQGDWELILTTSDGYPSHSKTLDLMLETLAKAQSDRHVGQAPTERQAQAHVQLASTLVSWFASGAVVKSSSRA